MQARFTPYSTPLSLKILLLTTLIISLFSKILGPYLALSFSGFQHLYLWQFATYLFVHPFPSGILHLIFNLYLIWIFGVSLLERVRAPLFFSLYFGSGVCAGFFALAAMYLFNLSTPFTGSSPALYALLVAWVLLNPEAHLLLFFAVPVKARNLLLILIGFNLLVDLSSANWVPLFGYIGSLLFGYFFTVISCKTRSPFSFLAPLERGLLRLVEKLEHLGKTNYHHTKIYDIKSGAPVLNDEQFMDAMLAKISLQGEESLSAEDRKRMQKISEKKAAGKK